MPRANRVLSFMSQWAVPPRSPTTTAPASPTIVQDTFTPSASTTKLNEAAPTSPTPIRSGRERSSSRPASMIYTYQPPMTNVALDTLPELMPIFTYLNAHSNRLYQEGYFLKLHDLDARGRPSAERNWAECFAQLVGTVLSIWDAAALDAAGANGEVVPTFINITDASIKMIESLPMNGQPGQSLQNVLSISTAANNRYLLHFNSLHSLTQWTAGIRLAMFEHASLQEAYTGSLIAGKGKQVNNIRQIMDRARFPSEDWARVRFGAGTPWRRCWCVVSPPGEKEIKNAQKALRKRSTYDKTRPTPTGDIKFYETRKITKKTKPIASITNAYSAYAIYPQSQPLIDQSTLVKVEGQITIHTDPPSTTEGFVFVMPEVHPAVTGFEIMLRWLFPVFDTFALYGRPDRLIPDVLDTRSLMFALPKDKRYGYLELLDVAGLLHTAGSQNWTEREWRQQMKDLTSKRMTSRPQTPSREDSRASPRRNTTSRTSLHSRGGTLRFDETPSLRSTSSTVLASPAPRPQEEILIPPRRTDSAPPTAGSVSTPHHQRSVSETNGHKRYQTETPSRLSHEAARRDEFETAPPPPPQHGVVMNGHYNPESNSSYTSDVGLGSSGRGTPDGETPRLNPVVKDVHHDAPLAPVAAPPAFVHKPNQKPPTQPLQAPDLRRANSALDAATLSQLADATHQPSIASAAAWNTSPDTNRNGAQSSATGGKGFDVLRLAPAIGLSSQSPPADHTAFQQGIHSRFGQPPNNPRLPTIPASPFVDPSTSSPDSPFFKSYSPQLPATSESEPTLSTQQELSGQTYLNYDQMHEGPSLTDNQLAAIVATRPDAPVQLSSSHSITRKPVPGHAQDTSSRGRSYHETIEPVPSLSSNGHDNASVDSPDYASTESGQSRKSVENPRPGVLRTIGNAELPVEGNHPPDSAMPIDFGPTFSYYPTTNSRPLTSGTETQKLDDKVQSNTHREMSGRTTPNFERPPAERRSTYGLADESSPAYGSGPDTGSRTPGSGPTTPGYDIVERDGRRTVAWSPGVTVNSRSQSRQALGPEQWGQPRAATSAQARTPVYAHQRQGSGGTPVYAHQRHGSGGTPPLSRNASGDWSQVPQNRTPPLVRNLSGDWLHMQQARTSPREIAYRPRPQEASANVSGVNFSQRLSAREQEHVARVTGSPLIQMSSNGHKQRQPSGGLIGAIEAREREKQEIRDGSRNAAVQQAILLRHQQQLQQQQEAVSQAHAQQLTRLPPGQQIVGQNQIANYSQSYGPMQGSFLMSQQALQAPYMAQQNQQPFQSTQMMPQQAQVWQQQQVIAQGGGWPSSMAPNVHQAAMTAGTYQQQPIVQQQPYGTYFANAQAAPQGPYGQQSPLGQHGYQR